jgi:arabinose-5-phosphate isomerase
VAAVNTRGQMVGLMTDGDVRRFILSGKYRPNAKVSDAMRVSPKTISASTMLYDALRVMEQHRITTLFVVDVQRRPKGVLHLHQIAEHQLV